MNHSSSSYEIFKALSSSLAFTMEDFFQHLDMLDNQPNIPALVPSSKESSFVLPSSQFNSAIHEEPVISVTEPPIPIIESAYASSEPSNHSDANNQLFPPPVALPSESINNQLSFMPTPCLPSNEAFASITELGFSSPMVNNPIIPSQSFPTIDSGNYYHYPVHQSNVPTQYIGMLNPAPLYHNQPFNMNLYRHARNLLPYGDSVEHDWEGIVSYLNGQVRPGPDVPRIYKCSTCLLEFPNAQAFGGHMSSHSKGRKNDHSDSSTGGSSKRAKVSKKAESSKKASSSRTTKLEKMPMEEKSNEAKKVGVDGDIEKLKTWQFGNKKMENIGVHK